MCNKLDQRDYFDELMDDLEAASRAVAEHAKQWEAAVAEGREVVDTTCLNSAVYNADIEAGEQYVERI